MNDDQDQTEQFLDGLRQELDNLRADADARVAEADARTADEHAWAATETARADKAEQSLRDMFRENADLANRIKLRVGLEQAKGLLVERLHITGPVMIGKTGPFEPMEAAGELIRRLARKNSRTIYAVGDDIVAHLTPPPHHGQHGRPTHQDCAICSGEAMDAGPVSEWRFWGAACAAHHLNVELWETMTLHGAIFE